MAIVKLNADGTYTKKANPSVFDNVLDGMKAPFLADDEALDADSAFWGSLAYAGVGVVGGGFFARRRAEAGKKPIAGFLL